MSPTKQLSPFVEWIYEVSRASTASQFCVLTCTMQLVKSIFDALWTSNVWLESGSVTNTHTGHVFEPLNAAIDWLVMLRLDLPMMPRKVVGSLAEAFNVSVALLEL